MSRYRVGGNRVVRHNQKQYALLIGGPCKNQVPAEAPLHIKLAFEFDQVAAAAKIEFLAATQNLVN